MRVRKSTNLNPLILCIFVVMIGVFGIFAANIQAAVITVTGNGDSIAADGQCTLREAITAANTDAAVNDCSAGAGADTINFSVTGEIVLNANGSLPALNSNISINGPGPHSLTVRRDEAAANFRIFTVSSGVIVSISGLTIADGNSPIGGGINNSGNLTIANTTITGNRCSSWGAGVFNAAAATLHVTNSTVSGNSASINGAGIDNDGTLTIEGSTLSGNISGLHGGGVYNYSTGTTTMSNTTISGNTASEGGGIFNQQFGALTVNNSTVTGNTGTAAAGGIRNNEGTLHLNSSIIANSVAPVFSDVWGPVASADYSLIENPTPLPGANNITGVDPMLAPLADNGGPTKTHALLPGSPAIDAGSNPNLFASDQRGYLRTHDFGSIPNGSGDGTDIGAFELDPDTDGDGVRDFSDNCVSTPNPQKIAFDSTRNANIDIYVMNADGTNQTRLTTNLASDVAPVFSSDGSKIAFRSNRDGNFEVYVMNADGSGQINLTNNAANDAEPAFSPDGSRIAFYSNRDGNFEIYVMNADGTGQTRLTNVAAGDFAPTFSPDGSKIAFYSERTGSAEIFVMNADGSNPTRLTDIGSADFQPEFSPDGSKIVFTSFRDGNYEIYVMNADGSGQTRVTNNAAIEGNPAFSPDGSKIVFRSNRHGDSNGEIYVVNADGSGEANLSNHLAYDSQPSWAGQADSDGDGIGDACENTAPTILPNAISRQQDAGSSNSVIAAVGDGEDDLDDLVVTVDSAGSATVNGVTVSNISVDAAGNVTADVSAACGASSAMFDLKVLDGGGLEATTILNVTVTNETTAPVIDPISNVTVYLPLNSPASSMVVNFPPPTATDNCSTPVVTTSPVSGSVFGIGTTTVNVTAKDALNNTSTSSFTVKVLYNFGGFLQPIDPMPVLNIAQAGSSIPVKFSLSGNKGLGILAAGYPISAAVACNQNEPGSQVEETDSAGNSVLTYDASSDQYKYVWKTNKQWKGTCRMLVVKLADGSEHFAKFGFK